MSSKPMQGWLKKQGGSIKTWKRRHCIIKDGALHYSKTPGAPPLGQMELRGSLIQSHSDPKRKNCFEIGTENRLYLLVADSDKEKTEWVNALKAEQARIEGRSPEPAAPQKEEPKEEEKAAAAPSSSSSSEPAATPAVEVRFSFFFFFCPFFLILFFVHFFCSFFLFYFLSFFFILFYNLVLNSFPSRKKKRSPKMISRN